MRRRIFLLVLALYGHLCSTTAFHVATTPPKSTMLLHANKNTFAVPASELEADLSAEERTVVSVVRANAPSVGFVTSIWPDPNTTTARAARQQQTRRQSQDSNNGLPRGQPLGSGSCFVVDQRGYLVTNYHVIQQAYEILAMADSMDRVVDEVRGNLSALVPLLDLNNTACPLRDRNDRPEVYVRVNSATQYQKCRIVNVQPELDVAVLRIQDNTTSNNKTLSVPAMTFGSSSSLLVGQGLIAIGSPFALECSVTTGVVSALNREVRAGTPSRFGMTMPIRNCIQTDCAINPGNSGGPLINRQGQVVGVNTAILTTSGSNAGIGFAVPSDAVQPVVDEIIRNDVHQIMAREKRSPAWLGVAILRRYQPKEQNVTSSKLSQNNWITAVQYNSPAAEAGMRPIRIQSNGTVVYGDAIVAVGGKTVSTYAELQAEVDRCVPGEQLAITLQDGSGERRVVYLTLTERPA